MGKKQKKSKQAEETLNENGNVTEQAVSEDVEPKKKSRRRGRSGWLCVLISIICLLVYCVSSMLYSQNHYRIKFYQEVSGYVTENLRIVFIADLHSREYGEGSSQLISDITSLSPDIILLGGDIINRDDADYQPMLDLCRKLTEIAPVYGALGNHESERMYPSLGSGDKKLVERFTEAGVHMLRNETELVTLGNNTIQLIGIEGTEAGVDMYGAREALDKMEFRSDMFSVLITHIPILFAEKLAPYPYDLGLAGHVHGGIVRLPWIGGVYSDEEKLLPKFCRGEYNMGSGRKLIISGGMGGSGLGLRINNTPELVVIDVNWC